MPLWFRRAGRLLCQRCSGILQLCPGLVQFTLFFADFVRTAISPSFSELLLALRHLPRFFAHIRFAFGP